MDIINATYQVHNIEIIAARPWLDSIYARLVALLVAERAGIMSRGRLGRLAVTKLLLTIEPEVLAAVIVAHVFSHTQVLNYEIGARLYGLEADLGKLVTGCETETPRVHLNGEDTNVLNDDLLNGGENLFDRLMASWTSKEAIEVGLQLIHRLVIAANGALISKAVKETRTNYPVGKPATFAVHHIYLDDATRKLARKDRDALGSMNAKSNTHLEAPEAWRFNDATNTIVGVSGALRPVTGRAATGHTNNHHGDVSQMDIDATNALMSVPLMVDTTMLAIVKHMVDQGMPLTEDVAALDDATAKLATLKVQLAAAQTEVEQGYAIRMAAIKADAAARRVALRAEIEALKLNLKGQAATMRAAAKGMGKEVLAATRATIVTMTADLKATVAAMRVALRTELNASKEVFMTEVSATRNAAREERRVACETRKIELDAAKAAVKGTRGAERQAAQAAVEAVKAKFAYLNNEALRLWKAVKKLDGEIVGAQQTRGMYRRVVNEAVRVAGQPFYCGWNMDFRMRRYADNSLLNPQGNAYQRALVRFNEFRPLGAVGLEMFIKFIGCFAYGAKSWEDGYTRAIANMAEIQAIGANPMLGITKLAGWGYHDNFVILSGVIELGRAMNSGNPEAFMSNYPLMIDATTSGFQFMAAMVRDEVAGQLVNIMCGDRQDLYGAVIAQALTNLKNGKTSVMSTLWIERIVAAGSKARAFAKPVTILTMYGGGFKTKVAAFMRKTETHDVLEARFMVNVINKAIDQVVQAATKTRKFVKGVAKTLMDANLPFSYITPTGTIVTQAYYETEVSEVAYTPAEGAKRVRRHIRVSTGKFNSHQISGAAANFTHSHDAALLAMTILDMAAEGNPMLAIHDCYGVHAGQLSRMMEAASANMATMFITDRLAALRDRAIALGVAEDKLPALPVYGTADPANFGGQYMLCV